MSRLHPATMIVAFLPAIWQAVVNVLPILIISAFSRREAMTEFAFAAIGMLGGLGAIATYLTTQYGIENNSLIWKSGWLFKKDRQIQLDQIQNVNIRQGLLERWLNVVTLDVETAAGTGSELQLKVLSHEAAEDLKRRLLPHSALAHTKPVFETGKRVFTLSRASLWLGALTENNGLQVIGFIISTIGILPIFVFLAGQPAFFEYVPKRILYVGGAIAAFLVLAFGWIVGIVSYILRFGNFSVREEEGHYRINHGVFTRVQIALKQSRVEYAETKSTVWQTMLGRASVAVGTAGAFGDHGRTAPIALMVSQEQADERVQSILRVGKISDFDWIKLPAYVYIVIVRRVIVGLTSYVALCWLVAESAPRLWKVITPAAIAVGVLQVLAGYFSIMSARRTRYAVQDGVFAVQSGYLSKRTQFLPLARTDVIATKQPSWWLKNGVTSLYLTAMAHSVGVSVAPITFAKELELMVSEAQNSATFKS